MHGWALITQYSAACPPNTQTQQGGGGKGRGGEREGGRVREGREEAMMLGRQRASVEEGRVGRVDEGNERGRDVTRHGRREGGSERSRD